MSVCSGWPYPKRPPISASQVGPIQSGLPSQPPKSALSKAASYLGLPSQPVDLSPRPRPQQPAPRLLSSASASASQPVGLGPRPQPQQASPSASASRPSASVLGLGLGHDQCSAPSASASAMNSTRPRKSQPPAPSRPWTSRHPSSTMDVPASNFVPAPCRTLHRLHLSTPAQPRPSPTIQNRPKELRTMSRFSSVPPGSQLTPDGVILGLFIPAQLRCPVSRPSPGHLHDGLRPPPSQPPVAPTPPSRSPTVPARPTYRLTCAD